MAQPTPYTRSYSFTGFQQNAPTTPLPGNKVDEQLNAVAQSIGQVCDNLELIQRDDGYLANLSVHKDALAAETRALIVAGGTPRGAHAASTDYSVKDLVSFANKTWMCHTAHTSSSSFDDTKFMLFSNGADLADSAFVQRFSGDGATSSFTLSQSFGTDEKALNVYVMSGSYYGLADPVSGYVLNGTNLTMTNAPPNGTNNLLCLAPSSALQTAVNNASLFAATAIIQATASAASASAASSSASAASSSASAASSSASAASSSASAAASSAAAAASTLASALWRGTRRITPADSPFTVTSAFNGTLIVCDTTSGSITLNLPAIGSLTLPYNMGVMIDAGSNSLTINRGGASDTIDGSTSKTIAASTNRGVELIADDTTAPDEWEVIDFGGDAIMEVANGGLDVTGGNAKIDPTNLTAAAPALGDRIITGDADDGNNVKYALVSEIVAFATPTPSAQTGNFTGGTSNGSLYVATPTTGTLVHTLPATAGLTAGFRQGIVNNTDGKNVTTSPDGSDTINGVAAAHRIPGQTTVWFVYIGSSAWRVESASQSEKVGQVVEWAGETLPNGGWTWLNGGTLNRVTYAGLFAVTGTLYGAGDGSTTFNVRDDGGRVKAGRERMGDVAAANRLTTAGSGINGSLLGVTGGAETVTLTAAQSGLPAHTHTYNSPTGASSVGVDGGGAIFNNAAGTATGSTGGSAASSAHTNTQPTITTNFIVKL